MGGLAGAEGNVLPGITFGLVGMGIGMGIVGTLLQEADGVVVGRVRTGCFPCRDCEWEWEWELAKKRLLFDMLGMRASGEVLSMAPVWWYCCCCCEDSPSSSSSVYCMVSTSMALGASLLAV